MSSATSHRNVLTGKLISERLAGTIAPSNPTDIGASMGLRHWDALMREVLDSELKPAGVLIPVFERDVGATVLLTQRSAELKHHAGQVSFPGGSMEDSDRDVLATALRETHEEVGIEPAQVSVAGYINTMPTITGFAVTPVVGIVASDAALTIDASEVEYAFEVPLEFLFDRRNEITVQRELFGKSMPMVEFRWESERIWGATAYMILALRKILINK